MRDMAWKMRYARSRAAPTPFEDISAQGSRDGGLLLGSAGASMFPLCRPDSKGSRTPGSCGGSRGGSRSTRRSLRQLAPFEELPRLTASQLPEEDAEITTKRTESPGRPTSPNGGTWWWQLDADRLTVPSCRNRERLGGGQKSTSLPELRCHQRPRLPTG